MNKFLKRITFVLIALVSIVTLVSCGDDEASVTEDGAAILKVAFAECGYGREFLLQWEKAYNEAYPNEKIKCMNKKYSSYSTSFFNIILL